MNKLTLEYLFPEVSNLYGDPFNVKYLAECIKENGYEVELFEDELNGRPYFTDNEPDFIYLGPMTEHSQELVIKALMPYRDRIRYLIDIGVVFFITGNAIEIFEKEIECEDGTVIPALGLYDFVAKRKMFARYNSLFLGKYEGIKIVGNKSQFSFSYGDSGAFPFIEVLRGDGTAPGEPFEGIEDNHFLATYLLGPLLLLNPGLTKALLRKLGIIDPILKFEDEAFKAYDLRLSEFENEETTLQ